MTRRAGVGWIAFTLASFIPATAGAYRTASDTPEFSDAGPVRWSDDIIWYRLYKAPPPGLFIDDVERAVQTAVTRWQAPSCSGLTFHYDGATFDRAAPDDATNTVEWLTSGWEGAGFAADAAALTDLAYQRAGGTDWRIVEADLYVNADTLHWVLGGSGPEGYRDVSSVLTHESGHMLGLLHPCEPDGADGAPECEGSGISSSTTMYPFYDASQVTLSEDDIDGVCFLYPRASCDNVTCDEGMACADGRCQPACGDDVCKANEFCTPDGCRRINEATRCVTDPDCGPDQHCAAGFCANRFSKLGDPCEDDADCTDGTCTDSGYCAELCSPEGVCSDGFTCVENASGTPGCSAELAPLGDACIDSTSCLADQCLDESGAAPVCTRECGDGRAACPDSWFCGRVGDRRVCRPDPLTEDGGCAVERAPRGPNGGGATLLAALASAVLVLRSRARARNREIP
jgi:hypothetical protein